VFAQSLQHAAVANNAEAAANASANKHFDSLTITFVPLLPISRLSGSTYCI